MITSPLHVSDRIASDRRRELPNCRHCGDTLTQCVSTGCQNTKLICACKEKWTELERELGMHSDCISARLHQLQKYEGLWHDLESSIQRRLHKRLEREP